MSGRLLLALALAMAAALGAAAGTVHAASSAGAGDTGTETLTEDLGHRDFLSYCAPCHGVDGRGGGTVAEFLTIAAADLTQLRKRNAGIYPRERVAEVIDGRTQVKVHGGRDMPVWGDWFNSEAATSNEAEGVRAEIVAERIRALVAFIETIQEN